MRALPAILALLALAPPPVRFRNVAHEAGVNFVLENSATPEKQIIETMAGGVAAFDYDGDGLTDIFFANGAGIPSLKKDAPKYRNRLFRNLGGMKFRDVTEEAGLAGEGYAIGASAADYDNDGHVDLFVAGVRSSHLYHNLGNGKFEDVTVKAGITNMGWAITGGWFDYDNDGRLDLLVVNYLKWSPENPPYCGDAVGNMRAYCHPRLFEGLPNQLFHNRGDGTFEDVSEKSGIAAHVGKGMSVAFADYDNDGFPDAFVTNDKIPSFLFHNLRNGKFEEVGLETGAALPDHGRPISAMGADFTDYDNDGLPDVFVAALAGETFPLFRNQGRTGFRDWTERSRLALPSSGRSGWSPLVFDFNNDGWKDLFTSNAHVNDTVEFFEPVKYKLANSIFLNAGGVFEDGSDGAGPDFQTAKAHRGAAVADFNGDGRLDVVVSAIGEPAELWENAGADQNTWLILKLHGTRSNRDGIGAKIRIGNQVSQMTSNRGYASSSLFGVHFGTGAAREVERIDIRWPSGIEQVLKAVKTNQVITVTEPVNQPIRIPRQGSRCTIDGGEEATVATRSGALEQPPPVGRGSEPSRECQRAVIIGCTFPHGQRISHFVGRFSYDAKSFLSSKRKYGRPLFLLCCRGLDNLRSGRLQHSCGSGFQPAQRPVVAGHFVAGAPNGRGERSRYPY